MREKTPSARRRGERGVALLLTLLVLAILAVVVVQFSYGINVERTIVKNVSDDEALTLAARGAVPYVAALFRDDRKNGKTPPSSDTLADNYNDSNLADLRKLTLGDVTVEITVEDLDRRLSLDWLARDDRQAATTLALQRLLDKLAVDGDRPAIAKQIRDKVRELAGAQAITDPGAPADGKQPPPPPPPPPPSGNPPGQDAPPPPKRGILWLEQLLAIDGLDPKVLYGDPKADPPKKGIAPFVTCWCTDALNLNTMPPEVLYAVLPQYNNSTPQGDVWGAADEIVKGIQKYRIDPDYQTAPPATTTPASPGAAPPPPPPPATTPSNPDQQQQGSGASGKWTGKAFETVGELQSPQIHALLGTIFESAPPAGGSGPATPPPPPAPGTPVTFKAMLATESRLYAIVVKATNGEGATKTLRMVVARNSADEVAPLFVREDPR